VYNLAGKKESWAPNPSIFIMVHEPPAFVYWDNGSQFYFHWHYARGATTLTSSSELKLDNQKFVSPILFVDGHVAKHDFSKAIKDNPMYPIEPTTNWIWYKPKN
jgi:prepilin-type processing-associated H-X9-DG protein